VALGDLAAGESARAWLSGFSPGTLSLEYDQKGNPVAGFQIDDFEPARLRREQFKLVLTIRPNQVDRMVEDDDVQTPWQSLLARIQDWVVSELRREF
jgi:hypothetical protein